MTGAVSRLNTSSNQYCLEIVGSVIKLLNQSVQHYQFYFVLHVL